MLVISDTPRSKLYKDKGYQEFLRRLHEKDDYDQLYDVICVHNQEELHRNQNTTRLFRNVLEDGKLLYKSPAAFRLK